SISARSVSRKRIRNSSQCIERCAGARNCISVRRSDAEVVNGPELATLCMKNGDELAGEINSGPFGLVCRPGRQCDWTSVADFVEVGFRDCRSRHIADGEQSRLQPAGDVFFAQVIRKNCVFDAKWPNGCAL